MTHAGQSVATLRVPRLVCQSATGRPGLRCWCYGMRYMEGAASLQSARQATVVRLLQSISARAREEGDLNYSVHRMNATW